MSGGLGAREEGEGDRLSNAQMGRESNAGTLPMGGRDTSHLTENPHVPGTYAGYVRNPPAPRGMERGSV